jgi:hypothetical protein
MRRSFCKCGADTRIYKQTRDNSGNASILQGCKSDHVSKSKRTLSQDLFLTDPTRCLEEKKTTGQLRGRKR